MKYYIKNKDDKSFLEGFEMNNILYGVRQMPLKNIEPTFTVGKYYIYQLHFNTDGLELLYEPKYCDDTLKQWFREHDDNTLFNEQEKKQYPVDMQKKYFMEGFKAACYMMAEKQFEEWLKQNHSAI